MDETFEDKATIEKLKEELSKLQARIAALEQRNVEQASALKQKDEQIHERESQISHYEKNRQKQQEKFHRIEQHFNSIIDSALDAIILADTHGIIILWSKGAQNLFGWTEKEALGKSLTLIMPERYHAMHLHGLDRFVKTREPHVVGKTVELTGKNRNGEEFPIDLSLGCWEINNQLFFCGIIRDVTIRRQADEERHRALMLEQKNKELEQFAYVASHDLQEPLKTISSFIELFKEHYHEKIDKTGEKYIYYILQSSNRMKQLISELLEYSRIGKAKIEEKVDFNKVVQNVLSYLRATIEEKKAQIHVEQLPSLKANPLEMKQLFMNLISNAIKFQKPNESPVIQISAVKRKNHWQFCVQDNGIGIDKRHQDKIFIIFQRLHPTSVYEGTGLGLALCKKIVEFHNGEIWVESEPGKGSAFYFTIKE